MLEFEFMRRALLAGLMLSIMLPLVGVVVVNRKTSMIGDALSHTSMAGVAIGLIAGINPTIGAIIICIISAFLIENIRKKFPQYGDLATAVVLSLGLGTAAVLQNFAPGGNTFESYLFGSISSVTGQDLVLTGLCFLALVFISVKYYSALLDIAISPNLARLAGVNVSFINNIFTLFTAVTIALACKVVGLLLVSSLLVLPVASSLIVAKSYKQTVFISILVSLICTMGGIIFSYYFDITPGGIIVLIAVAFMSLFFLFSKIRKPARQVA